MLFTWNKTSKNDDITIINIQDINCAIKQSIIETLKTTKLQNILSNIGVIKYPVIKFNGINISLPYHI